MSERLAIAPPPAENELPPPDRDEILVGNIVSPGHEGLQGAVDATPGAGYELPREEVNTSGEPTSESMFREAARDYVPTGMRDRDPLLDPLQGYEQRVMNDAREHFVENPLHEPEHERRKQAPRNIEAILIDYVGSYTEDNLGFMDSPEDPFREISADLPGKIRSLREQLQSPRAHERAAATNKLTDMAIAMFGVAEGKSFSAEERLDCYAFAPDQARGFLHQLKEALSSVMEGGSQTGETFSQEERKIVDMILQYCQELTHEAEQQDSLLDGASLFGSAVEKAFTEHIVSGSDGQEGAERQKALVRSVYDKLRLQAVQQLEKQRHTSSGYELAA